MDEKKTRLCIEWPMSKINGLYDDGLSFVGKFWNNEHIISKYMKIILFFAHLYIKVVFRLQEGVGFVYLKITSLIFFHHKIHFIFVYNKFIKK